MNRYRANGPELISAVRAHAPPGCNLPGAIDASERAAFQDEVFGATRERMLREFCDRLLSTGRPWVLVLEDLHWSDFATLDDAVSLRAQERQARVLVLCSYRPADGSVGGHPIRRLHRDLGSSWVLQRITPRSIVAFGGRALPGIALRRRATCLQPVKAVFERTLGHP